MEQDQILDEIIRRIVAVAAPDKILLFGSRAKGTARKDSDYDLLVVKSKITSRRDLAKQIYRNLRGIRQAVDIIVETPEHLAARTADPSLVQYDAVKEGTVIYG